MKTGVIYIITNTINNKLYIGQTVQVLKKRIQSHFRTQKGKNPTMLKNAIDKYGKENFKWEVLCECPVQDLDTQEKYWIKYFNSFGKNGYNMNEGGNYNLRNLVRTPEHCRKISESLTGKKLSAEHRKTLSESHKNPSDEIREKNRLGHIGKKHPHSEETKLKISKANKGKKRTAEFCERMSIIHKEKSVSVKFKNKANETTVPNETV